MNIASLALAGIITLLPSLSQSAFGQCNSDNRTQMLHALVGSSGDAFGGALAVTDKRIVVGAHGYGNSGTAYVFEEDAGFGWTMTARLAAPPGSWDFGTSVAHDGGPIVVGATFFGSTGAAYVFENRGTSWVRTAQLLPSGGMSEGFGTSVAIDGNKIVVGAPNEDLPGGATDAGAVYVFEWRGLSWVETQRLVAGDAAQVGHFGYSLAIADGRLVVGACDPGPTADREATYLFETNGTGILAQVAKLVPPSGVGCGHSVDIEGDLVAATSRHGICQLFRRFSGLWIHVEEIPNPGNISPFTRNDYSVSLDQGRILMSDRQSYPELGTAGGAYLLENLGGGWTPTVRLEAAGYSQFGYPVTLLGDSAYIGSIAADTPAGANTGAVFIFATDPVPAWEFGDGCAGSGGFIPRLVVAPTGSIPPLWDSCVRAGTNLSVEVQEGLGGSTMLLFAGPAPASIPLGGGCTLHVDPILANVSLPLADSGPGNGSVSFLATISATAPPSSVYLQAFVIDQGVPRGFSNTKGRRLSVH